MPEPGGDSEGQGESEDGDQDRQKAPTDRSGEPLGAGGPGDQKHVEAAPEARGAVDSVKTTLGGYGAPILGRETAFSCRPGGRYADGKQAWAFKAYCNAMGSSKREILPVQVM